MKFPIIDHHGAVTGVTGSCHQLHADAANSYLIDCGLFQGAETSSSGKAGQGSRNIEFPLDTIKALIATHVHIDHVGCIPYLLAAGFKGPILCSEPSAKLLPIVLEDAFKLGVSRDQKQVERYINLIEQRIVALPYQTWFTLHESPSLNCRVRLQRAGHILGSAYVEFDLTYPTTNTNKRIVSLVISARPTRHSCGHQYHQSGPIFWCWKAPTAIVCTRIAKLAASGLKRLSSRHCRTRVPC